MPFSASVAFLINFEEISLLLVDSMRMKTSHLMGTSRVLYLAFPPRTHPPTQMNEFTNWNAHAFSEKNKKKTLQFSQLE